MADRLGQQFGNYRLVSLLGQGGYAEVYLGQHVRLDLQAAIKVLHTHLTGSEAEHFQQEAQTIARLAHPSIIFVTSVASSTSYDNRAWYVLYPLVIAGLLIFSVFVFAINLLFYRKR